MLNKYPSQTNSRRMLAALGCAFTVLGIFLIIFDAVGQGVVFAVTGIMLDMLCFFASEKGYERAERFLFWFT
ncbi:hypothetical protein [Pseudomonas sp. NPDC087639]|uniref:hypothetical protein n=1 Tax=Pseudomonas sp. NPDC087639 TaxID=3364445 RepID=UPI0038307657